MTEVEQEVDTRTDQERHADVYGVSREELKKREAEQDKSDNGGSICTICHVKGCNIGPMGRG